MTAVVVETVNTNKIVLRVSKRSVRRRRRRNSRLRRIVVVERASTDASSGNRDGRERNSERESSRRTRRRPSGERIDVTREQTVASRRGGRVLAEESEGDARGVGRRRGRYDPSCDQRDGKTSVRLGGKTARSEDQCSLEQS